MKALIYTVGTFLFFFGMLTVSAEYYQYALPCMLVGAALLIVALEKK